MINSAWDSLRRLRADHGEGRRAGLYAVCSAQRHVLEAAMAMAAVEGQPFLVEATAQQVNLAGGYTGMTPAMFRDRLLGMSAAMGLAPRQIMLGADHLGPHLWKTEPAAQAMSKAAALARACVAAGFGKIHLDTGWGCVDDPASDASPEITAARAAQLCRAAESAARDLPASVPRPLYTIGVEVPPPGGALQSREALSVTMPAAVAQMLRLTEASFRAAGLEAAWERVVGIVVQPGVEFGDRDVARYQPEKVAALSLFHHRLPGAMVFEVHATDYQLPESLAQMVQDHFALLKVGPALSNAFREAVFSLALIETEWLEQGRSQALSGIRQRLERAMQAEPRYWQDHYLGTAAEQRWLRAYSLRDRVRYYWSLPVVEGALQQLLRNLRRPIPHSLLSQYFPDIYPAIRSGEVPADDPEALIRCRIQAILRHYGAACHPLPVKGKHSK